MCLLTQLPPFVSLSVSPQLVPPMVPKVGAAGDRTNYPEPYSSKADAPEVSLSASQLAYCDIQQPRAQDD